MFNFRNLLRNLNLLNIILIAVTIILVNYIVLPVFNINVKYMLPPRKKITVNKEEKIIDKPYTLFDSSYTIIAEENLFHPERKIPVEKKEEQPLPKPDVVLYGTLITDDISLAYIEDLKAPFSTPGRGKRQTALRKGDIISCFTLKEVEADKIVMVRGDDKMVVLLNDPRKPKTRETSALSTQAAPDKPAQAPPSSQRPKTGKISKPSRPITPKEFQKALTPPDSGSSKGEVIPAQSYEEQKIINLFKR